MEIKNIWKIDENVVKVLYSLFVSKEHDVGFGGNVWHSFEIYSACPNSLGVKHKYVE